MKAALALVFFACIAGSMASDARGDLLNGFFGQSQAIVQAVVSQLNQQLSGVLQQAFGQLTGLLGSIGGRFDFPKFEDLMNLAKPIIDKLTQGLLSQLTGGLAGLMGGRAEINLSAIFSEFLATIQGSIAGIGQHLMNQGLGAVLGSLGGSRGIGDIFAAITQQISSAVTAAQGALSGALGGITALGSQLLDASKPHWEQLQEQLVGHGLNVLGSLSETINNVHGSITGGR
jgi:hypothetical protein